MVRKKQATIRAAAKHKQSRREQIARARKHRKVEQLGCTDAELRQQSGGVEDESSTSTAGSCDTFLGGNTLSQFKTETYQAISAQNSAEKFSADASDYTPVFEPAPAAEMALVDISELCALVGTLSCSQCKQDSLSLTVDTKKSKGLAVYAMVYCSTCEETVCERYLATNAKA